jgi:hypothetical protein
MMTLDPIKQPLPPVRAWIVRGTKHVEGGVARFTGSAWGRTEEDARRSHERLLAADRRVRAAGGVEGTDLDLTGYTLEFEPLESVPPTY